jgi:hypothetical protein
MKKFVKDLAKEIAYHFKVAFSNLYFGLLEDLRKAHGIKD